MSSAYRDRPHFVYRLLGKRGRVLYIGCTMNLARRLSEWRYSANVGPLLGRVETLGPFPFEEARRVERDLIEAQRPAFNIEHTPRRKQPWAKRAVAR